MRAHLEVFGCKKMEAASGKPIARRGFSSSIRILPGEKKGE
jgi:hypothetical protein